MFSFNPLWKTLIDRNMTKTQLRELVGISTSTLSKLSKDEYVSMQVLDSICDVLKVSSIREVVEYVREDGDVVEESNLDILENIINNMIYNLSVKKPIVYADQFHLYSVLKNTIKEHDKIKTASDADRFSKIYNKCSSKELLPTHMMSEINLAVWNIPNTI